MCGELKLQNFDTAANHINNLLFWFFVRASKIALKQVAAKIKLLNHCVESQNVNMLTLLQIIYFILFLVELAKLHLKEWQLKLNYGISALKNLSFTILWWKLIILPPFKLQPKYQPSGYLFFLFSIFTLSLFCLL